MTDKEQIIIDGVDVSGCDQIFKDSYNAICCNNFNKDDRPCLPRRWQCRYYVKSIEEQLARKTQECEWLRTKLEYYIEKTKQLLDDIDNKDRFNSELQQECEELKEKIKQVKDFNDKVLYGKDELYKNWREQLDKTNQLKKENEELKEYKAVVDELAGKQIILTNKDKMPKLYENAKDLKLNRYRKALEEIERIATTFRARESSYHNVLDIISKAKENKQWD